MISIQLQQESGVQVCEAMIMSSNINRVCVKLQHTFLKPDTGLLHKYNYADPCVVYDGYLISATKFFI